MTAPLRRAALPLDDLREIAVIRALPGLGDLLCAVPALRSLRAGCPDARVTLVGLAGSRWFVDRFSQYVDALTVLPHWPTIPEARQPPSTTVRWLAGPLPAFDLAIQLQGCGGPINQLGRALGARVVLGHDVDDPVVDSRWRLRPWPSEGHELRRLRELLVWAGFPDMGDELEFDQRPGDVREAASALQSLTPHTVVVHPGASVAHRRWPVGGFAGIVDRLHDAGFDVLLTGTAPERALLSGLASRCIRPPRVLDPPIGIGALAAVLRRARAVVVNDTGVAHLAVATGTPTLVIANPSGDPLRWAPLDQRRHRVVVSTDDLLADVDRVWDVFDALVPQGSIRGGVG